MDPKEFCYWLQGMLEGAGLKSLSEDQVEVVRQHLDTVFKPVTKLALERAVGIDEMVREALDREVVLDPAAARTTPLPHCSSGRRIC